MMLQILTDDSFCYQVQRGWPDVHWNLTQEAYIPQRAKNKKKLGKR